MTKLYNRNRILALFLMLISSVLGWYSLILFTNVCDSKTYPIPSIDQIYGLFFTFLIAILVWIKKCCTIIPN